MSSISSVTTPFDALLANSSLFDVIVFEWLDTRDLVALDTAAVHAASRAKLHAALSGVRFKVPFGDVPSLYWRNYWRILEWVADRKMYSSEGTWHMNHKLWDKLLSTPKMHPVMASFRDLRFENFHAASNLDGLSMCTRLEKLDLNNFVFSDENSGAGAGEGPVELPMLRELVMMCSTLNDPLLRFFDGAPRLEKLSMCRMRYADDLTAECAHAFFSRFSELHVYAEIDKFVKHASKSDAAMPRLSVLRLDNMASTEEIAPDLSSFLRKCPELRDLTISCLRVHIPSLFEWLGEFTPRLVRLHLDNARITEKKPNATAPAPVAANHAPLVFCTKLQLSSVIPSTIAETTRILSYARHVDDLTLWMMNRLDGAAMHTIAGLRRFASVEIHERERYLQDGSGLGGGGTRMLEEIKAAFDDTPRLKIVQWSEWLKENERLIRANSSKVLLDRVN